MSEPVEAEHLDYRLVMGVLTVKWPFSDGVEWNIIRQNTVTLMWPVLAVM